MAFTPFSAQKAKVRIGASANVLTAKKWNVDHSVDPIDTSNFELAGFTDVIAGLVTGKVTIDFDVDGSAMPQDTPLFLTPGTAIGPVKLYMSDTTGPYWNFAKMMVLTVTNPADVKAGMGMTVQLQNKGTFSPPTGAIS